MIARRTAAWLLAVMLAATAQAARANDADLAGTWIAVHGIEGDVIGNIEELRIAKDGSISVYVHHDRQTPPCDGPGSRANADCRRPMLHASGTVSVVGSEGRLMFAGSLGPSLALPEPDGTLGQKYWLKPGGRYAFKRDGKRLLIHNVEAPVERSVPHPRLTRWPETAFFEADPDLAADLVDYANAFVVPTVTLSCVLPVVYADPRNDRLFRDFVRDMARFNRHMADLQERALAKNASVAISEALQSFTKLEPGLPRDQLEIERWAQTIGVSTRSLEHFLRWTKAPAQRAPALPPGLVGIDDLPGCIEAFYK